MEKIDFKSKVYKEGLKDTSYILEDIDDIYTSLDESMASSEHSSGLKVCEALEN